MTGQSQTLPKEVMDLNEKERVLYVEDPDFFYTNDAVSLREKGWKIQLRIPER